MEALTNSGSTGSWAPSFTFEGIMGMVIQNMLHTEEVEVQTATGPGGRSGPLRVNLGRPFEFGGPHLEYSLEQAQGAFVRGVQHHTQHGW